MDPCLLAGIFFFQVFGASHLCSERTHRRDVGLHACGCQKFLDQLVHGKRQALGQERSEIRKSKDGALDVVKLVLGVSLNIKPNQIL